MIRFMIRFGQPVPQDVDQRLERLVSALAADPRIDVVWLFGSRARREHDALSDVDIAVLGRRDATRSELFEASIEWTGQANEILSTDEVAVQPVNHMPVALRHGILRDARMLWERAPRAAADHEAETRKRYLDFAPHLRRYDDELFRQAATGRLR